MRDYHKSRVNLENSRQGGFCGISSPQSPDPMQFMSKNMFEIIYTIKIPSTLPERGRRTVPRSPSFGLVAAYRGGNYGKTATAQLRQSYK
jgi:hypothetical protein